MIPQAELDAWLCEPLTGLFTTGREHLGALVEGVRLRLLLHVAAAQEAGLLVERPDRWAGSFFAPPAAVRPPAQAPQGAEVERLRAAVAHLDAVVAARERASATCGVPLPLASVRDAFGLDSTASALLVLATAAELSEAVRRTVAFLQDDVTRQAPDGALALALLATTEGERDAVRDALRIDAPLLRHRLLCPPLVDDPDRIGVLRMELVPARRVVEFLRDDTGLDPALEGLATLSPPTTGHPEITRGLILSEEVRARLQGAADTFVSAAEQGTLPAGSPVLLLYGPEGTGKRTVASALASRLGGAALIADARRARLSDEALVKLAREARLLRALLVLHFSEALDPVTADRLRALTERDPLPLVVCVDTEQRPSLDLRPRAVMAAQLSRPDHETRTSLWTQAMRRLPGAEGLDPAWLAARYRVTGGTIRSVVQSLRLAGSGRGDVGRLIEDALEAHTGERLGPLVERMTPGGSLDELVVSPEVRERLELIVAQHQHAELVFGTWGLGRRIPRRGLTALFHGPPGTGKTHAARILARMLDLELLRVDLSQVVSKFIGETEKNLGALFDELASRRALLLFDEADSLFATRTSVSSSHDRYANQETSYLLQRIERFEGVAILTTNLEASMDTAFVRRINHRVHFAAPGPVERARLWELLVPRVALGAAPIDFAGLGEDFDLSGGHIANAVLRAAFLAALAEEPITQAHLLRAANEEYQSLGKVVREIVPRRKP
ncbi:MAG: ATPase [Myxococcales bacterium]